MLKTVITNENGYGGTLEGIPFLSLKNSQTVFKRLDAVFFFRKSEKEAAI